MHLHSPICFENSANNTAFQKIPLLACVRLLPVRNCRRCPLQVREQLELMKRAKTGPDFRKSDKPKHGGRKVFFRRLWCRIQRLPLPKVEKLPAGFYDGPEKDKAGEKKKRKRSADTAENENPRKKSDSDLEDEDGVCSATDESRAVIYRGRTHLAREDDPHWLSEADCYIRGELVEVFAAQEEDLELFGNPELGQVGVRCFYCAENRAPGDRDRGHVYYPSSLGAVQQAVADLQRRHLSLCSEIPEHERDSFRSMKGYGAKPKGDTTQYWIDALKELGLCDSQESQGIEFFRNPLLATPADALSDDAPTESVLIPAEDRHKCTDQMLLLIKQFKPCQFQMSDRKSSRSRDRTLGFPGLACIHCNHSYFPVSEKKLQDSLTLMIAHINKCVHAPLDVKASLCYLHHRALLQKQELPKSTLLVSCVWNRLHEHSRDPVDADLINSDGKETLKMLRGEDVPVADHAPMDEDKFFDHALPLDTDEIEDQERAAALEDMKDLIKSAALWLTECDAEHEARALRGRLRGNKRR